MAHAVMVMVKMCTVVFCGSLHCVVMQAVSKVPPSAQCHNTVDHNPHFQIKVTDLNEEYFMS